MANAKWTTKSPTSTAALTDYALIVRTPGGTPASNVITLGNFLKYGPFTLEASATTFDPEDSSTYYIGSCPTLAPATTGARRRVYIPRAGVLTACYGFVNISGGTLGTTESVTVAIQLNNTTDTTVTSALTLDANSNTYNKTDLTIAVAAGDYIELKISTPAWATNPTSVYWNSVFYFTG